MKARSLTFWLTAYLGTAWLALLLALGFILWQSVHHVLEQALADKSRALASQLAAVSVDAMLLRDYGSLERSVGELATQGGLVYVDIRRADGVVLARAGEEAGAGRLLRAPLVVAGEELGEVAVRADTRATRDAALRLTGVLALGLALFSLFAFYALRRLLVGRMITPVRALLDRADPESLAPADADAPVEVRELAEAMRALQARVAAHVSALEEAAQTRNEALRRLCGEQRLATVGQLAGEVAHELNTPLANILCYAQMELDRAADADSRRALEIVTEQARRAGEIVRDMLTVARAPAVQSQAVELSALCGSFVRLLAPLARRQSAEVALRSAGEAWVWADPSRLEQILFNLATNALQAGARHITLGLEAGTTPALSLIDDGPGVDPGVRQRMFEPFVTTKPAGQGTGLGLAICRRLAEEMNGALTLRASAPGHTEFRLELPSAQARDAPALQET